MSKRPDIRELLDDRILVIDGSMGALIMSKEPDEAFYRGERLKDHHIDVKNATDLLVLTQPRIRGYPGNNRIRWGGDGPVTG